MNAAQFGTCLWSMNHDDVPFANTDLHYRSRVWQTFQKCFPSKISQIRGAFDFYGVERGVLNECSSTKSPTAALARVSSTRFVSRRLMGAFVKYEMDLRVCGLVAFKTENLRKTAQAHFPRL